MMNFRKITISIFALLSIAKIAAQQSFYPFTYEDKDGLTDDKGNEIVAPIYDYWSESENEKLFIFKPKYDSNGKATLCFDVTKKQGKEYKTFYQDEVTIQKVQHHFVEELNGKKYLLNSETEETIPFKEDVYTVNDLNDDYIIAKYFPKETKAPKITLEQAPFMKVKGKIPPPPSPKKVVGTSIEDREENYVIYSSTSALKPVLKTEANNYFLLNKEIAVNKPDGNGNVEVQIIGRNLDDFDFVLFENQGAYQLYDKNFKLIKKFTSKPSSEYEVNEDALKKCEIFSTSKIEKRRGAYPTMASDREIEKPKFTIERDNDIYYLVSKNNGENKKILSSPYKLEYSREGRLRIEDQKADKTTSFKFNETTFQLYIPQKYLQVLNVKLLN